jgi:hypothetical protein
VDLNDLGESFTILYVDFVLQRKHTYWQLRPVTWITFPFLQRACVSPSNTSPCILFYQSIYSAHGNIGSAKQVTTIGNDKCFSSADISEGVGGDMLERPEDALNLVIRSTVTRLFLCYISIEVLDKLIWISAWFLNAYIKSSA